LELREAADINNVQVIQATDNTYTSGNPGMGFYLHRAANLNADFGFSRFSAWDTGSGPIPAPRAPTNVRIITALQLLKNPFALLLPPGLLETPRETAPTH
jgi:hypothetical protein